MIFHVSLTLPVQIPELNPVCGYPPNQTSSKLKARVALKSTDQIAGD